MKIKTAGLVGGALALLICAQTYTADARRFGGLGRPYVHRAYIHPAARGVYWRGGRYWGSGRWVNGVWVVNGVAASVAAGTASNCGYYWNRWQATGRPYWREGYNEMCG